MFSHCESLPVLMIVLLIWRNLLNIFWLLACLMRFDDDDEPCGWECDHKSDITLFMQDEAVYRSVGSVA